MSGILSLKEKGNILIKKSIEKMGILFTGLEMIFSKLLLFDVIIWIFSLSIGSFDVNNERSVSNNVVNVSNMIYKNEEIKCYVIFLLSEKWITTVLCLEI